MERRKFLIGAGSTAIGASALVGSGAFSSVEAERGFAVDTADDADAYLGLTSESPYAFETDGMLRLDFTEDNPNINSGIGGGEGVNKDATTTFIHVFSIHNQGSNTVGIQIDRPDLDGNADHVHFFVGEHGGDTLSDYEREEMADELNYDTSGDDDRVIGPGEELKVGLYFYNEGEEWDFDGSFTINALDEGTADHVSS